MADPIIFPSNIGYLGIAKEAAGSRGTPIASPTIWIPMMDPQHKPNQTVLEDVAMRGNMNELQNTVPGVRYDTLSYKTGLYIDSLFTHMLAIMGGTDVLTGAGDPYTHKTSVLNTSPGQPPSFTLFLHNGAETWQLAGATASKIDISVKADALAELSADWTGLVATKISNPTNTPSTVKPWPAWNSTITVNSIASTQYSDITLSYTRQVKAVNTADGTQAPYTIFAGPVGGEIDLTGVYQGYTGSDLEKYLAGTSIPVVVKVNPSGDATHYGQWTHSTCTSTDSSIKSSGGDYVEVSVKYKAVANSTDTTTGGGTGPSFGQFTLLTTASTSF